MTIIKQKINELNQLKRRALIIIDRDIKEELTKQQSAAVHKMAKRLSNITNSEILWEAKLQFKIWAKNLERLEDIRIQITDAKNFRELWELIYGNLRDFAIYHMSGNTDNLKNQTDTLADHISVFIRKYR